MSEGERKKSNSSESDLSDSWSVVEYSDTTLTPLHTYTDTSLSTLPRYSDTTAPRSSNTALPTNGSVSEWRSTSADSARGVSASTSETETSSDAESVDIIQDEFSALNHHHHHPHRITTKITAPPAEGDGAEVEEKELPELWGITTSTAALHHSTGQYGSMVLHSSEWFRLLVFTSSLVALLLLLVSYATLFFKEQAYSRSEGMIVLPDEELSSLISDLTIIKEENSRLKKELNMIKYEYGSNMKGEKVDEEITVETGRVEQVIGLEVIGKQAAPDPGSIPPTAATDTLGREDATASSESSPADRLRHLALLEQQLRTFADSVGLTNVVLSSYNIAHNLDGINTIVAGLNAAIDRQASTRRDARKSQLQQRLTKLLNRIEQDLRKSVEKVARRVDKFYRESLDMFCRIKGGVSDAEAIDCSGSDSTASGRVGPGERMKDRPSSRSRIDPATHHLHDSFDIS